MSASAERQRRYRRHKAGDHSLCTSRCSVVAGEAVTSPVTQDVTPAVTSPSAPELGQRGRRLWQDVADGGELQPGERVLLEEACRLADRLDVLDRILRGDEDSWLRLTALTDDGSVVRVVVNNALAEARQQQVALKQLLAELRQSRGGVSKPGGRPGRPQVAQSGKGGTVADLTSRIRARAQPAS